MANTPLDPYDCGCGWLEQAAADPGVPIDFDAETNEYYVKVKMGEIEGRMFIKFCPNCGGDAPISTRDKRFSVVSMEDRSRVFGFASKYRTDRKSTRLNSSHQIISYAVFCLKKKKNIGLYKYSGIIVALLVRR